MEKTAHYIKIAKIIAKANDNELSPKEQEIIDNWLAENKENRRILDELKDKKYISNEIENLKTIDSKNAFKKVTERINETQKRSVSLTRNVLKYAAAITLFIIGSYAIYLFTNQVQGGNSITPGSPQAILITSGNKKITLGNSNEENIIKLKDAVAKDKDQELVYEENDPSLQQPEDIEYNRLLVPIGGEYTLVLSDGSKIKLNSGSELKYPVVFHKNARKVELQGEAYFEVAKSSSQPFIVKVDEVKIKVYGTSFNVSAYSSDNEIQTTLVEGSVGISYGKQNELVETKIVPGEQSIYFKNTGSMETQKVDTYLFTAWTKNVFAFENEHINTLLVKLSRWYDFEFEFKNEELKNQRFTGSLNRYENIDKIVEMISKTSNVKFEINGKKIIIYSENNIGK